MGFSPQVEREIKSKIEKRKGEVYVYERERENENESSYPLGIFGFF